MVAEEAREGRGRVRNRQEKLVQLRLDILGEDAEGEEALSLSGIQRREEYAATFDRLKLRRALGELVEVDHLEPLFSNAGVAMRRRMMRITPELAQKLVMSIDELQLLREMLERACNEFCDDIAIDRIKGNA